MSRSTDINSWEYWEDDEEANIDLALAEELDKKVFEIDQDQFFKTFLAGKPGDLAQQCWDALKNPDSASFNTTIESQIKAELEALEKEKETEKEEKTAKKKKEEKTAKKKETKHPDADGLGDDATEEAIRNAIRNAILSRLPTYDEAHQQLSLPAKVAREEDLYPQLASLLTFINYFYRNYLESEDGVDRIDKAWPRAAQTWSLGDAGGEGGSSTQSDPPSQNGPAHYLRRRFAVLLKKAPHYTRQDNRDGFHPDLALVLQRSENPRLPNPLGWKDIKVAIEVKPSIQNPLRQTARYARCMKLEQFDRNFFFTLTIAGKEFRLARWDPAACYITPSLDFYKDPLNFIHVIGQLACMSPQQLGYDQTFSNAGRVLHSESTKSNCGIRTILTITPCQASEDFQESENGDEAEHKNEDKDEGKGKGKEKEEEDDLRESHDMPPGSPIKESFQYLLDDDLLCEARDLLFCRSTRVWKAWPITESGRLAPPNAIKQNWHDEDRINEAWFYEQTKDIAHGVAHMIHFEDLDRTRGASSMIESHHVLATWTRGSKTKPILERKKYEGNTSALDNLCHRVLLRFVLQEVGLPLSRIKTPRQLVHVMRDIAIALEALYDRNILHRDISEGNILLYEDAVHGYYAFLTDFGLAMKLDPDTKLPLPSSVKHDHMTGTLPFIATIFHNVHEPYTPLSMIHHDVESLFLVGVYTVFKFASCEGSESMSKKEKGEIATCGEDLDLLRSPQARSLYEHKKSILLFKADVKFPGRWSSIRDFFSNVAFVCYARFQVALDKLTAGADPDPLNHDLRTVVGAADAVLSGDSRVGLDAFAPTPLPLPSSRSASRPPVQSERATSTSTTSKGKRRRDDENSTSDQGRHDNLSATRERSKRSRKGASSEADQEL